MRHSDWCSRCSSELVSPLLSSFLNLRWSSRTVPAKTNHSAQRTILGTFYSSRHPLPHFAGILLTWNPSPRSSLSLLFLRIFTRALQRACEYQCGLLLLHSELPCLCVNVRFVLTFDPFIFTLATSFFLPSSFFCSAPLDILYTAAIAQTIQYDNM